MNRRSPNCSGTSGTGGERGSTQVMLGKTSIHQDSESTADVPQGRTTSIVGPTQQPESKFACQHPSAPNQVPTSFHPASSSHLRQLPHHPRRLLPGFTQRHQELCRQHAHPLIQGLALRYLQQYRSVQIGRYGQRQLGQVVSAGGACGEVVCTRATRCQAHLAAAPTPKTRPIPSHTTYLFRKENQFPSSDRFGPN